MKTFRRSFDCRGWAAVVSIVAATLAPAVAAAQQSRPSPTDVQASLVKVPAEVPTDARRMSFLLAGNKAGLLALWTTQDGARHSFFAFNDRGRGPA
ncbi:MAG TPA: hypothetical protein VIB08_11790, partial [Thermoanaerobaculia bacterium]